MTTEEQIRRDAIAAGQEKPEKHDDLVKRETYKAVKVMDRKALSAYIAKIWTAGFQTGFKAGQRGAAQPAKEEGGASV